MSSTPRLGEPVSHQSRRASEIMVSSNFIRAVRESGYTNLSTALAELVDNSLQAGASTVAITIERASGAAHPEITVTDNGGGMSASQLELSLRFGGSSRFDGRDSFGRFGMGLPAASLSQARRVEVTAWRGGGLEQSVSLDVDEIVSGAPVTLRARRGRRSTGSPSGCQVVWKVCDRIEYRRLGWLERALHRDLGRMYRRFLSGGLTLTVNGSSVEAYDPLLLSARIEGCAAALAFKPMRYELVTASGESAFVTVRFSILPVQRWQRLDNVTKRRLGIVGGGGVSILRAGREIAKGWHLMGGKRRENYDDWWRCEIEFDPVLDEHFGITINKQGVRPSPGLREALEPELESMARILNARVRQAFEDVKFQAAAAGSCRIAEAADRDLPVLRVRGRGKAGALRYTISTGQMPMESMFATSLKDGILDVQLNVDHPAFAALYSPLQVLGDEAGGNLRTALELFILALARSAVANPTNNSPDELLRRWGSTYGRMLLKA